MSSLAPYLFLSVNPTAQTLRCLIDGVWELFDPQPVLGAATGHICYGTRDGDIVVYDGVNYQRHRRRENIWEAQPPPGGVVVPYDCCSHSATPEILWVHTGATIQRYLEGVGWTEPVIGFIGTGPFQIAERLPDDVWATLTDAPTSHLRRGGNVGAWTDEWPTVLGLLGAIGDPTSIFAPGNGLLYVGTSLSCVARFDGVTWSLLPTVGTGSISGIWGSGDDALWVLESGAPDIGLIKKLASNLLIWDLQATLTPQTSTVGRLLVGKNTNQLVMVGVNAAATKTARTLDGLTWALVAYPAEAGNVTGLGIFLQDGNWSFENATLAFAGRPDSWGMDPSTGALGNDLLGGAEDVATFGTGAVPPPEETFEEEWSADSVLELASGDKEELTYGGGSATVDSFEHSWHPNAAGTSNEQSKLLLGSTDQVEAIIGFDPLGDPDTKDSFEPGDGWTENKWLNCPGTEEATFDVAPEAFEDFEEDWATTDALLPTVTWWTLGEAWEVGWTTLLNW